MFKAIRKILSHDCGPFWQLVKYGAIGVGATVIQTVVFYILASTCLPCLKADDWAVKLLSLPSAAVADSVRAWRFVIATALAFVAANIPCWILNRLFVFRAGRYFWLLELLFFMAVSRFSTLPLPRLMKSGKNSLQSRVGVSMLTAIMDISWASSGNRML